MVKDIFKTKKKCQTTNIFKDKNEQVKYYKFSLNQNYVQQNIINNYSQPKKIDKITKAKIPKLKTKRASRRSLKKKNKSSDTNLLRFKEIENRLSNYFYKNIDFQSLKNTLNYIFYGFKDGIYVSIRDNKLVNYIFFSNNKYYSHYQDILNKYKIASNIEKKSILEKNRWLPVFCSIMMIDINEMKGNMSEKDAEKFSKSVKPPTNYIIPRHWIEEVLKKGVKNKKYSVFDCDFFLNIKDRLILSYSWKN